MRRLFSSLLKVEGAIAVAAYAVTCGLLLADVAARELASQSIWGAQKLAVFGAIIAGILGLSIAVGNNAHLRASFADRILPWHWVDRVGDLVSALLFAGLCWYAIVFVSESLTFRDRAEVINIPLWPIQLVFPYAFGTAALRHFVFFLMPDVKPVPAGEG
ncbi:TRAP transporter small permease [Shimia aestuarii]|uniref:TRAP transporter small permease protein n=1 Tax=Shimia aestuarii TaxID=254406 RepID=A0A1I4Q5V0_9RHOB|nr:TRAP transporter small permease [Shimia aestuarii]SFM35035.1 TRAP-type C4-dicarboxylate transport system, small permease component [Shimia aestuarii]